MFIRIKRNAAVHTVEIDGTKFDVPANQVRADGLRELVVNYYCRVKGYAPLYPEAET